MNFSHIFMQNNGRSGDLTCKSRCISPCLPGIGINQMVLTMAIEDEESELNFAVLRMPTARGILYGGVGTAKEE